MHYLVVAILGVLATVVMTSVHMIAERASMGVTDFTRSTTAFVLPERLRGGAALTYVLQAAGGVVFALLYDYVLGFLQPAVILDFVRFGALGGLLHGYFIGLFFMAFNPDGGLDTFHLPSGLLNLSTHILFGLVVGLGLGIFHVNGTLMPFVFGVVLTTGLLWAAAMTLISKKKKRAWGRLSAQRRRDRLVDA